MPYPVTQHYNNITIQLMSVIFGLDLVSMSKTSKNANVFIAQCTLVQSAVLRSHVVRLSVHLSVCDSTDVGLLTYCRSAASWVSRHSYSKHSYDGPDTLCACQTIASQSRYSVDNLQLVPSTVWTCQALQRFPQGDHEKVRDAAIHSQHRLTRPLELKVTMPGSSRTVRRRKSRGSPAETCSPQGRGPT